VISFSSARTTLAQVISASSACPCDFGLTGSSALSDNDVNPTLVVPRDRVSIGGDCGAEATEAGMVAAGGETAGVGCVDVGLEKKLNFRIPVGCDAAGGEGVASSWAAGALEETPLTVLVQLDTKLVRGEVPCSGPGDGERASPIVVEGSIAELFSFSLFHNLIPHPVLAFTPWDVG